MNCESVVEVLPDLVEGALSSLQAADCRRHVSSCSNCADALRGVEALGLIKSRDTGETRAELFDQIRHGLEDEPEKKHAAKRFWMGTGFGGAIAASIFAFALTLGWIETPSATSEPKVAEFAIAHNVARIMDIAIEADQQLPGAKITILLSGGIELEGYAGQRELSWISDLDAGVNRLSLPVIAIGDGSGQMVVQLSHPDSQQVFVVELKTDA